MFRTYKAIDIIAKDIIKDGLCEAILLKGSIGRGDDDQYSDVDMYLIVNPDNLEAVLNKRKQYLEAYKNIVYLSDINFGLPQKVTIYEDGLHLDLYVGTPEQLDHSDPIKVYYDKSGMFESYTYERKEVSQESIIRCFEEAMYYFIEADTAYRRKNFAWAARILDDSTALTAVLLRYIYDKKYAFLGLKKINEIIPKEQYTLLENAYAYLGRDFKKSNDCTIAALDIFVEQASEELRQKLNIPLFNWIKSSMGTVLFSIEN